MRRTIIGLSAVAISALPTLALADGDGALTGAAGGAVTGAIVGGPVGAAVGGVAGAAIGGAASGPGPVVVTPGLGPCDTRTKPHRITTPAPASPHRRRIALTKLGGMQRRARVPTA